VELHPDNTTPHLYNTILVDQTFSVDLPDTMTTTLVIQKRPDLSHSRANYARGGTHNKDPLWDWTIHDESINGYLKLTQVDYFKPSFSKQMLHL
jgi:hypothetical protein